MHKSKLLEVIMASPEAALELMLLAEYLKEKGYSTEGILSLTPEQTRKLLSEASTHVSCRLAEIETWVKLFSSGDLSRE